MDKRKIKWANEILELLTKLEPVEFVGICRLMNITLGMVEKDEEGNDVPTLRPAEKLMEDIINKFMTYNKVQRRNFMAILRGAAANK